MTDQPDFIGRFPVIDTLGVGGMGVVYLAQDPDIGRSVAIKVLHANRSQSDLDRFKNEARTIGELSHPNIVVLLEYGVDQGHPLLVMEYLEGQSLEIWIQSAHKLAEHKSIITDLCNALSFAHHKQILHRDLKPGNVQVLPGGQAKLLDFGIARSHDTNLTMSGMVVGTPKYLAPECLKGGGHSRRSDCYSLGLLAYTMLSGHNPFSGDSYEEVIIKQLTLQPPSLHDLNPKIPVNLSKVIDRYLNKKPDKRPDSLDLLKETLSQLRSQALLDKVIKPAPRKASADTLEETLLAAQQPVEEPKRGALGILFKLALVVIMAVGGWIVWGQYNGPTRSVISPKQAPVVETAPKAIEAPRDQKPVAESTALAADDLPKPTADLTADPEQVADKSIVSEQPLIQKDREALPPREVSTPVADVADVADDPEQDRDEVPVLQQSKAPSAPTETVETSSNTVDKAVAATIPVPAHVNTIVKPSEPAKTVSKQKPRVRNTAAKKRSEAKKRNETKKRSETKQKETQKVIAHKRPVITLPTFTKISRNDGMTLLSSSKVLRGKTSKLLIEVAGDLKIDGFKVFRGRHETSVIKVMRFRNINNKRLEVSLYVGNNATLGNYILYGVHQGRKTRPIQLAVTL